MYRVLTKAQRAEIKKGPRRYGVQRPIPFAMAMRRKNRIKTRRYKKKWHRKIQNWWRDLVPEALQPELRRVGKGVSFDNLNDMIKKKMTDIAGLSNLSDTWYSELSTNVGYSLDLMYYVYRRRPGDFEGFSKYFLLRTMNVACIEDVAEIGELYQFLEKNFYHEMRAHHYAVRVHTAWLNVISRHALMSPHKFFGGPSAPFAELGLNLDGTLANGLVDPSYHAIDGTAIAQLVSRINQAVKTLNIFISERDIMKAQHGELPRASPEDQAELEAFLLLAHYVSQFEQMFRALPNPEVRAAVPYFSTYLLVKKSYEQYRPMFQWHPICAARSTDFVQKQLPVAGDPVRIFSHYFSNIESQRRGETQLLTPSSHTYEGLLRALLASGRLNKFVEFSRYYQDPEIHSLALRKFYRTQDWVLGQKFIVRNFKCGIDDLTMRQNALEPTVEDLGFMIAIFSKNSKRKAALVLAKQLVERVETHPHEVVGCKIPFADAKDYTKVHDLQLFASILKAERAIKEKQSELGVKVGFGAEIEVDDSVVQSMRFVAQQHQKPLSEVPAENRRYVPDWKAPHPSLELTPLQRARKARRMERHAERQKQGRKYNDDSDPYKNAFRAMTPAQYKEYMENQKAVFKAQRASKLVDAL